MTDWCILRTSGKSTLVLATKLTLAGFEIWTPIKVEQRAVRRGKIVVKEERSMPIAPTLVFADAARIDDLDRLRAQPFNGFPDFSIFQWGGRRPLISDRGLSGLRSAEDDAASRIDALRQEDARQQQRVERAKALRTERERRKALRAERLNLAAGLAVSVRDYPALTGMSGVVVESKRDGAAALIAFGGALMIEIEAWQLIPKDVIGDTTLAA